MQTLIKWSLYKMSSQVLSTRTWLLKPQNEVLYKKLIAFLHYRKTAPKWPLYKKLVHPTWFIHTTICLQWLGNQPHFFSIKQLVFFSFIRDPSPLKTQRKSKRGSTWRLLSKHKMPAKCWRGFLPTKIDHEFSWPHEPQNSFPTTVHWDFNMSKKVSATCPYKSQLMLSSSL